MELVVFVKTTLENLHMKFGKIRAQTETPK